jgi:hypothetical protein
MLRAGTEAAVDAAMHQPGAQLGGMPPSAFITGLARDLGEPACCVMEAAEQLLPCDSPPLADTPWWVHLHGFLIGWRAVV